MVFPLLRLGNSSQSLPASPGWLFIQMCFLHQRNCAKPFSLGDLEDWGQLRKYIKSVCLCLTWLLGLPSDLSGCVIPED